MPIFETVDTYASGSGNWVCPAGVYLVLVEVWASGAGGGGGSVANQGGGGGGGGGYARRWIRVTPGSSYAYSVGAAGAGASGDTDGFDGNPSYFINSSSGCRAEGGVHGLGGVNAGIGGEGGVPTYYDTGYAGGKGSDQTPNGGGGGGSAGTGSDGNDAVNTSTGATAVTGGGNGGNGGSTGNGSAPTGSPGGGGGGGGFPLSGSRNGGAGKVGKITISYSKMRVFGSTMTTQ